MRARIPTGHACSSVTTTQRCGSWSQPCLEQRGYRALTASSGERAIKLAAAHRPDVVLLDLLLPGMSGWDVAAELRARPETHAIPLVILSTLSQAESRACAGAPVEWVERRSTRMPCAARSSVPFSWR